MLLHCNLCLVSCKITPGGCMQSHIYSAGHAGCGVDSATSFPVYLEYIIGDTSYLLAVLRYKVHCYYNRRNAYYEVSYYTWLGPHPLLVQNFILFAYPCLLGVKVFNSLGHKLVAFVIMNQSGSWTMLHCCPLMKSIHHCLTPLTGHCNQVLFCFTQGVGSRLGT